MVNLDLAHNVINEFLITLNKVDSMKAFLDFCATHPEISMENLVLMYLTNPKLPRFICHKGIAESFGIEIKNPIPLIHCVLSETRANFVTLEGCYMYSVPESVMKVEQVSLKDVLQRMGWDVYETEDKSLDINRDKRILATPKSWSDKERNSNLVDFLMDYFYEAYKERKNWLINPPTDYVDIYRPLLVYMLRTYLGVKNTYLTAQQVLTFTDVSKLEINKYMAIQSRFAILIYLFQEIIQIIEGFHFTVYESELFRLAEGNPYAQTFQVAQTNIDLKLAYASFLYRYNATGILQLSFQDVHIFPPFVFPKAAMIKKA